MPIQVTCACGQKLKAPDNLASKTVRCPKCKQPLKIPAIPVDDADLDLELELSAPATNPMDDLLSSELPATPTTESPLAPVANRGNQPHQAASSKSSSEGFPAWMLWTIGGVTAVLLLSLGVAMVLTSMRSGSAPDEAEIAIADPAAPPDANVAKAFAESNEQKGGTSQSSPSSNNASQQKLEPSQKTVTQKPAEELNAEELAQIEKDLSGDHQTAERELGIPPEELEKIKATFTGLSELVKRGASNALGTEFDLERGLEESETRGYVKNLALVEPETVSDGFLSIAAQGIFRLVSNLDFENYEIRYAGISEDGREAEIIMQIDIPGQYRTLKLRWWLYKREDKWRVYDVEDLQLGIRQSALVVMTFGRSDRDREELEGARNAIQALNRAWQAQNNASLGQAISQLDEFPLSNDIDMMRHILRGRWHYANQEFEKALEEFGVVQKISPQTTIIYLLQAAALTQIGRYQGSLKQIKEYELRLGRDDESWGMLGFTLYAAGEREQALAAFKKGMEYNPHSVNCLVLMSEAFSPDNLEKLRPYIVESALPLPAFQQVAMQIEELGQTAAFDFLMKARRESQRK